MAEFAFIGAGNMASAMVQGLLAPGRLAPRDLACFSASGVSAAALAARTGITAADSLEALLAEAAVVIVAFKPQHLATADPRLAAWTEGRLVVSVLAAKTLAQLARAFPRARNLVRTMPNTPAAIGAGITGWCAQRPLIPEDRARLDTLLGAIGQAVEIEEAHIDALMAVSGCGPAYVFEFAAALREAGVSAGLDRALAQKLAVQTLLGASRLLAQTAIDPETLRQQVTSPQGTTLAGLRRLEAHGFRDMVREAVLAAQARSVELSRDT